MLKGDAMLESQFEGLESLEGIDLDKLDPASITEKDAEILSKLVAKETEAIAEELAEATQCPVCNTQLSNTAFGVICLTCLKTEMGKRTLTNCKDRLINVARVYQASYELGRPPKTSQDMLYTLIPNCLLGTDLAKERALIEQGASSLSRAEREFVRLFTEVWDAYPKLVKRAEEVATKKAEESAEVVEEEKVEQNV